MSHRFIPLVRSTLLRVITTLGLALAVIAGLFGAQAGYGQESLPQDLPFGPVLPW